MKTSEKLKKNVENRDALIETLKAELIGPIPVNDSLMIPMKVKEEVLLDTSEDIYKHYYNSENGEEILQRNAPIMQYSAGILFPHKTENEIVEELPEYDSNTGSEESETLTTDGELQINKMAQRKQYDDEETPDLMPGKNDFNPSSIGISFYLKAENSAPSINVNLTGGIYWPFKVGVKGESRKWDWWCRKPAFFKDRAGEITFDLSEALNAKKLVEKKNVTFEHLTFQLQVYVRKLESRNTGEELLVTVSATNITENDQVRDMEKMLYQSQLSIEIKEGAGEFLPYPNSIHHTDGSQDEEVLSSKLLYRKANTYALGHGCSADWISNSDGDGIIEISTTFLPEQEVINMTPDIRDQHGNELSLSMMELAGAKTGAKPVEQVLSSLISSYEKWIEDKSDEIHEIEEWLQPTAVRHLKECKTALNRMKKGLACLEDEQVLKAFKLANFAMAVQQTAGTKIRDGKIVEGKVVMDTVGIYKLPSTSEIDSWDEKKANWRAFQAAFLLMSIPSFCGDIDEREIVDLIWFPTGGGKTEAYLGTASFAMFLRRLKNPEDSGTDVLMRYTLRLLTADQFQRSSRLICTMEVMRSNEEKLLGKTPFSIGIWLGGTTTPNRNIDAKNKLNAWESGNENEAFLVKSCPWCGTKIGQYKNETPVKKVFKGKFGKKKSGNLEIKGYSFNKTEGQLKTYCPDSACHFNQKLPVYIVDETIYQERPSLLIGTVDKFAMLAWNPEARSIFGINPNGEREVSPPNLIIQDELHLISGPLGSVTGLYEVLIENLSTDYRGEKGIKPKIIAATATVRGYKEQGNALYARGKEKISIFPSPGLSFDDSFFAKVHLGEDNKPSPGKKYVGIASNLVGLQTIQVKTYTTILQKTMEFRGNEARDPYWTLLSFYNSIRELGGSLTLFQTDIPSYFLQFRNKHKIPENVEQRNLNGFKELTSRLSNGEVTDAIGELKKRVGEDTPTDVCLASNIIEVGIDIDRLSLMTVVGQPKNTAQYIQVTGRVGRAWYERPGLVITLYKSSISRDKSHFEHFKEYHQKLYTHVEATSVTPFSEPSLERGLYGVVIGWLRQSQDNNIAYSPAGIREYSDELEKLKVIILNRVQTVDSSQVQVVETYFDKVVNHLLNSEAQKWDSRGPQNSSYFLMRSAGEYVEERYKKTSKPVLTSMRNVDASCKGTITDEYVRREIDA